MDITTTNNQYLLKFFSVGKDSIMGVAERNNVYLSTDNGNNFRFYASITSNASLLQPEYYYFKNRLFFQNRINLYEWNLNDKFIEYDKTGIPDYLILTNFHLIKDTLFVTTEGGGVYRKAFSDLSPK